MSKLFAKRLSHFFLSHDWLFKCSPNFFLNFEFFVVMNFCFVGKQLFWRYL